ncbi:MAG: ABC transporter ATP-binding protein, partial [Firmicutes bacterium]|nr:ABC transporter ATP-binding protein [Bacillota bacterium]
MDLLVVRNVSKNFGGLQVVSRASLEVAAGSLTGLVGPNGSGKSTLFHLIYGLVRPDGGTIFFRGRPLQGLPPHAVYREGLAFAFQLPRLFWRLSVLDNLLLAARQRDGETMARAVFSRRRWQKEEEALADKAHSVLELLGLTPLALEPTAKLSGGQRKLL